MPMLVGMVKSDPPSPPRIVIRSVGCDGMEINREYMSLAEAESHVLAVQLAIMLGRTEGVRESRGHSRHGCGAALAGR